MLLRHFHSSACPCVFTWVQRQVLVHRALRSKVREALSSGLLVLVLGAMGHSSAKSNRTLLSQAISGTACWPCEDSDIQAIRTRLARAVVTSPKGLGVLVLPGSFNPVHSEHIRSLELARAHFEAEGISVVGGFLQPSSDRYVANKCGLHAALPLQHRITACKLAAEADATETWIHVWRSGSVSGGAATRAVQALVNKVAQEACPTWGTPIVAYTVCGTDFVERCGGWNYAPDPEMVVISRPGCSLPDSPPSKGWHLVQGDTQPLSSTCVREAITTGEWDKLSDLGCHKDVVGFLRDLHSRGALFIGQIGG